MVKRDAVQQINLKAGRLGSFLFWGFAASFLVFILFRAHIAEDAYITFRVIDQFAAGNGLRWNIDERVQVYTHPLWMLLHLPLYLLWDNIFFISLFLCLAATIGAIAFTLTTFERPPAQAAVFFLLPMLLSETMVDYATSGLENPLMHALFAAAGYVLIRHRQHPRFWFLITFVVSLSLITRLDMAIIYAPLGLYLLLTNRRSIRWKQAIAGTAPFIAWHLFSLFYYGFFFPNTKYAKLGTGIDTSVYLQKGWGYFQNLFMVDTLSALWLIATFAMTFLLARRYVQRQEEQPALYACLCAGAAFYSLYVIYVGGWHTYGRYWSLPVFASIWVFYAVWGDAPGGKKLLLFTALLCAIKILSPTYHGWRSMCPPCFNRVYPLKIKNHIGLKDYLLSDKELRNPASRKSKRKVLVAGQIGKFGFTAPREQIIVDNWALCDPLLARLPGKNRMLLPRTVPAGYIQFRINGSMRRMEQSLTEYYKPLRLIVSGDLWDWERLKTIVAFNLGAYDDARDRYIKRHYRRAN